MKKLYYTEEEKRLAVNRWNREYAKRNKEKVKQWGLTSYHRRKNDPENIKKFLLKNAKARAVKKGIIFSLTEEDIFLPEICPIMKIPFDRNTRKYGYSIDRIDSTKGYTKDNIWIISQIANAMKWDSTNEERLLFAKWILSLEGGERT